MRIAVYENLPRGGAKRAAFELGRYLAARHGVDLYQLSTTNNQAFDLRPYVRQDYIYSFRPLGGLLDARIADGHLAPRSYTIFRPLRAVHRRIAKDIAERGYDVVLAHTDAMTQAPYLLQWLRDLPSVYYCQEVLRVAHEPEARRAHRRTLMASRFPIGLLRVAEDALVQPRLEASDRRCTQAAGVIAVNSQYSRDRVRASYGREAVVCYLGVDTQVFRPPAGPAAPRPSLVLSVGGPPRAKGHLTVIDALALLPASSRPALVVVLPIRREVDLLERHAAASGVRLTIEIGISDEALAARYGSALATVCAAPGEPFGFTPLESMACATPVIALDQGGYRETVRPGESGFLVENQPTAIARSIARLAESPDLAARLGAHGRAWIQAAWSWEGSGARLEGVLREASHARVPA